MGLTDEGTELLTSPSFTDGERRDRVREIWQTHLAELRKARKVRLSPADTEPDADEAAEEGTWKERLLDQLMAMAPAVFERLARPLLREADFDRVNVTGQSGDGGIDGLGVYRLGLVSFPVFFQCKRYRGSVGPSLVLPADLRADPAALGDCQAVWRAPAAWLSLRPGWSDRSAAVQRAIGRTRTARSVLIVGGSYRSLAVCRTAVICAASRRQPSFFAVLRNWVFRTPALVSWPSKQALRSLRASSAIRPPRCAADPARRACDVSGPTRRTGRLRQDRSIPGGRAPGLRQSR